jgi:hypothetical protein
LWKVIVSGRCACKWTSKELWNIRNLKRWWEADETGDCGSASGPREGAREGGGSKREQRQRPRTSSASGLAPSRPVAKVAYW